MYARLMLLTLVTALFMGAWNSDQAQIQAALARREQRRETLIAQRNSAIVHPPAREQTGELLDHQTIHGARVFSERQRTVSGRQPAFGGGHAALGMSSRDSIVPLPPGIAPGQYRAVNNNGIVQTIRVAANDEITENSQDFYMVDATADERWYLIRVQ